MIASIRRQMQLYLANKAGVFFSIMGAWIAFGLYLIFLQKNMLDSFSNLENAREVLDKWVMAGTLAVTSITATWTIVSRQVKDKETSRYADFLLTDLSEFQIQVTYLVSATLIAFLMQLMVYFLMQTYFAWQDNLSLVWKSFPSLVGLMFLAALMSAALNLLLLQCFKRVETVDRLSILIGTASGFLVGVYMPIGLLPDFAQLLIKLTPGAYVAAVYRQLLISENSLATKEAREYLGIGLNLDGLMSFSQGVWLIIALTVFSLVILFAVTLVKSRQKG